MMKLAVARQQEKTKAATASFWRGLVVLATAMMMTTAFSPPPVTTTTTKAKTVAGFFVVPFYEKANENNFFVPAVVSRRQPLQSSLTSGDEHRVETTTATTTQEETSEEDESTLEEKDQDYQTIRGEGSEESVETEEAAEAQAAEVAASTTEEEKKHTVYMGNLPFAATREKIYDIFEENGMKALRVSMPLNPPGKKEEEEEVEASKVADDADSNAKAANSITKNKKATNKGYCFVDVESPSEIEKAIQVLNGANLDGRQMRVSKLLPKEELTAMEKNNNSRRGRNRHQNNNNYDVPDGQKKLYVGNLPFDATEEEIRECFEEFGNVFDLFLPVNNRGEEDNNRPRGFCFVTMNESDADEAAAELNGATFLGRTMVVSEPLKRGESPPQQRNNKRRGRLREEEEENAFKVYVGNLSFSTSTETLLGVFEEFGEVLDCYLPIDPVTDRPRGFGFVTMESREDGEQAVEELDGIELEGRFLRVNEAKGKRRGPPSQSPPPPLLAEGEYDDDFRGNNEDEEVGGGVF